MVIIGLQHYLDSFQTNQRILSPSIHDGYVKRINSLASQFRNPVPRIAGQGKGARQQAGSAYIPPILSSLAAFLNVIKDDSLVRSQAAYLSAPAAAL